MFTMTTPNMPRPISSPRPNAAPAPSTATSTGVLRSVRRTTHAYTSSESAAVARPSTRVRGTFHCTAPTSALPPNETSPTATSCHNSRMTCPS